MKITEEHIYKIISNLGTGDYHQFSDDGKYGYQDSAGIYTMIRDVLEGTV